MRMRSAMIMATRYSDRNSPSSSRRPTCSRPFVAGRRSTMPSSCTRQKRGSSTLGVIDTFGWFCLFNEADVQITRFRQWEEYLTVIRELAGTHRLECREIDAALWYAGTTRRDLAMANQ